MQIIAPATRSTVGICGSILALTLVGKVFGLVHGGGLLTQPHPFLPGTFEHYVWLGLAAELLAFVAWAAAGVRAFLTVCLGLAVLFIGYHALEVGLQVSSACPCLGGLLGHWKFLAQAESAVSFLLACGLAWAAFVGLFPVSPLAQAVAPPQSARLSAAFAIALWLFAGTSVVWFWQGRTLGGDEGMEAAKSLQLLAHPENAERMWNDQPPLWSAIGAGIFHLFGPSMTAGRIVVVLLGTVMVLVWATYWSRAGVKGAAIVSVILLWLAAPSYFASFMLESPAYAIGMAALLPLTMRGHGRLELFLSALIAALALSLKLTAAFALVVPFTWLLLRVWRCAFIWGFLVVGLTVVGSLIQPGWSWSLMGASHLNFEAVYAAQYRLDPALYAQGWLICLLATFAVAGRYVKSQLEPVIPWLSAAIVALLVHLFHRPFWNYYNVHLMTPLVVLAGVGAVDLWRALREAAISRWERRIAAVGAIVLALLWTWHQGERIALAHNTSVRITASTITKELKSLGKSGHTMFAMNPSWTFAAGQVQTPPELTIIPLKRAWSGQINDTAIAAMLASNRVDALVLNQGVLKQPEWTNLLAGYFPTARDGRNILFVRRELNPKPIDLSVTSETTIDLRKLGL